MLHDGRRFQFPSNGKAYPKESDDPEHRRGVWRFQFPSNGKAYPKYLCLDDSAREECFNSLQTGKRIPRGTTSFKVIAEMTFQFPSNGKAYPKDMCNLEKGYYSEVSIPFKRESVSQGDSYNNRDNRYYMFQFPSNGKAYPKWTYLSGPLMSSKGFNSLQTGKRIPSAIAAHGFSAGDAGFQFPSNGKAYPKSKMKKTSTIAQPISFNSLQTGKRIPRCNIS